MEDAAGTTSRPWTRLVIGFALATAVVATTVAVVAGADDADDDPSLYDLEVVLGEEPALAAVWSVTVNGHGAVAAAASLDGDRPVARILLTDGRSPVEDLSGGALARTATVPGIAIDRRNNVLAIDEFSSGDFTRRRAAMWSPRAPGQPTPLVEGAWNVAGQPAEGTVHVPGRRATMSAMGPGLAAIDIRDGTERAQHRVLGVMGELSEGIAEASLEEEPIRPSTSADGTVVLSTGDEIVVVEPGTQHTHTLARRADGFAHLGAAPAVSEDGRIIAFVADRGEGPTVYAARRTAARAWTDPVGLDAPEPLSIDEPLTATSMRHPPEIGDVGVVAFRGRGEPPAGGDGGTGTDDTTLWALVLADGPDTTRALEVTATRAVVRVGARIGDREVTAIHPQPVLAAPEERTDAPDDHWLAFGVDTDAGALVVRAVPHGSGLREHVPDLSDMMHQHH